MEKPFIPNQLIGYRKNGQPIYLIAGGSSEEDDESDNANDNNDDQTTDGDGHHLNKNDSKNNHNDNDFDPDLGYKNYRKKNNEAQNLRKERDNLKETIKKLQDDNEEHQKIAKQFTELQRELVVEKIIRETGLNAQKIARLKGETYDELLEAAQEFAAPSNAGYSAGLKGGLNPQEEAPPTDPGKFLDWVRNSRKH